MAKAYLNNDFESQMGLLEHRSDENDISSNPQHSGTPVHRMPSRRLVESLTLKSFYIVLLHIILLAVIASWIQETTSGRLELKGYEGFSPAQKVISYETVSTWPGNHNAHQAPYSGPPSVENNHAWDALTRSMFFNASKEELTQAGETLDDSVQLEDGSYLASTRVHHDVHCLRQIRLFIYRETYYPNLTEAQHLYLRHHIDHCIEAIRMSLMCTGDISLYTFFWHDPPREKPGTKTNSKRMCIRWDRVQQWSESRMIPKNANVVRPEAELGKRAAS